MTATQRKIETAHLPTANATPMLPPITSRDFKRCATELGARHKKYVDPYKTLRAELKKLYPLTAALIDLARRYGNCFHRSYDEIAQHMGQIASESTMRRHRKKLIEMGILADLSGTWKNRSQWKLNEAWFAKIVDQHLSELGILHGQNDRSHIISNNCLNNINTLKDRDTLGGGDKPSGEVAENREGGDSKVRDINAPTKQERYLMTNMGVTCQQAREVIRNHPAERIREVILKVLADEKDGKVKHSKAGYFLAMVSNGILKSSSQERAEEGQRAAIERRDQVLAETREILDRHDGWERSEKSVAREACAGLRKLLGAE